MTTQMKTKTKDRKHEMTRKQQQFKKTNTEDRRLYRRQQLITKHNAKIGQWEQVKNKPKVTNTRQ